MEHADRQWLEQRFESVRGDVRIAMVDLKNDLRTEAREMHNVNVHSLARIEEQTLKTNGRVDALETMQERFKLDLSNLWRKVKGLGSDAGKGDDQHVTFRHIGWILFLLGLGVSIGVAIVKMGGHP